MKVFLEFAVGDLEVNKNEIEQWTKFSAYVDSRAEMYGITEKANDLDDDQLSMMKDLYSSETGTAILLEREPEPAIVGRINFELFDDCPKTSENFKCLVTGEKGIGKHGKSMHYKNTTMFRAITGAFIHGGDITRGDGSGGDSIYGGKFNDEKAGLQRKHTGIGFLSMANSGKKNTNTSQFFITLGKCPKLDGKHVIFGQMIDGLDVLEKLQMKAEINDHQEKPKHTITITNCDTFS